MSNNQKPLLTIRDGALKASIWVNITEDGKTFHSVTFGRTYSDNGEAKTASSFSGGDILKIGRLADKAYDHIAAMRLELARQQESA